MAYRSCCLAVLLFYQAYGSPLETRQQATAAPPLYGPPTSNSIDDALLYTFNLEEQYAAASYCNYNNEHPDGGLALDCEGLANGNANQIDVCPWVEKESQKTVYEFRTVGWTDNTGYIAIDETKDLIILSYRGSHDLNNFIADVDFLWKYVGSWCFDCWVHAGFYTSYLQTKDAVIQNVTAASAQNPGKRVVVVGHSLGGALASLATIDLRLGGLTVDLYTYGQPRIGNWRVAHLITYSDPKLGGNFRVAHKNDIVTGLPPWHLSYVHWGPQYYISTGNGVPVGTGDVTQYNWEIAGGPNGTQPSGGGRPQEPGQTTEAEPAPPGYDSNEDQGAGLPSVAAHLWYFRSVTGCDPTSTGQNLSVEIAGWEASLSGAAISLPSNTIVSF